MPPSRCLSTWRTTRHFSKRYLGGFAQQIPQKTKTRGAFSSFRFSAITIPHIISKKMTAGWPRTSFLVAQCLHLTFSQVPRDMRNVHGWSILRSCIFKRDWALWRVGICLARTTLALPSTGSSYRMKTPKVICLNYWKVRDFWHPQSMPTEGLRVLREDAIRDGKPSNDGDVLFNR